MADVFTHVKLHYQDELAFASNDGVAVAQRMVLVWTLGKDDEGSKIEKIVLCQTDSDGVLHPAGRSLQHGSSGEDTRLSLFPLGPVNDTGSQLARNFPTSRMGWFAVWPFDPEHSDPTLTLAYLKKHRLWTGLVPFGRPALKLLRSLEKRELHSGFNFSGSAGQQLLVSIPCSVDVYLNRIQRLTESINERVDAYQKYYVNAMTCGAVLDEAHTLIVAKNREIEKNSWLDAGGGLETYKKQALPLPETKIISEEVFSELQADLVRKVEYRRDRTNLENEVNELRGILESQSYNQQYRRADWEKSAYSELDAEAVNAEAIEAIARWSPEEAQGLVKQIGLKEMLEVSAQGKRSALQAAEKVEKTAVWLWKAKGKIVKLATIKNKLEFTAKLNWHVHYKRDLIGAARFLEVSDVMQDVDNLEEEIALAARRGRLLGTETKRFQETKIGSELDKYIKPSFKHMGEDAIARADEIVAGFGVGLAGIEFAAALADEKPGIQDDLKDITSGIKLGADLSSLKMVQRRAPGFAKLAKSVGKRASVAGSVVDWAGSVQDLYKAADGGASDDFAYSVASYAGKGLVAGGSILLLTPFAPLGGVLVAAGSAIDIVSGVVKSGDGLINYQSAEEKTYLKLVKKLREHSPDKGKGNNLYDLEYSVLVNQSMSETDAFQRLLDRANKRQERALKDKYEDVKIKDFIRHLLSPGYTRSNINWVLYKSA